MPLYYSSRPSCRVILALAAAALVMACTTSQDPATRTDGINDPYEAQNRSVHAFNKGLDRNLVRPVSKGYAAVIPPEIRESVTNFANNLSEPGDAINSLLQGDLAGAGIATTRFAMNSTLGLFGFFDPSTELNIEDHDTDFGETLAVWGVGEGAYIEMPIFGPSTQRDAIGFRDRRLHQPAYLRDRQFQPRKLDTPSITRCSLAERSRPAWNCNRLCFVRQRRQLRTNPLNLPAEPPI